MFSSKHRSCPSCWCSSCLQEYAYFAADNLIFQEIRERTASSGFPAKVVATGANLVLITRGIEKTTRALVSELKAISKEVEDGELADADAAAAVSAGNNNEIGNMIDEAMSKVGRKGVITLEKRNRISSV
ncbi:hypothetical protein J1N35_025320 [Gossypium stocksii]|uniref:Uncharacterized protein n=1 Tax=Gossypium stocksii TaxID=47602 RepID=A0A9D3ZX16_9ROSI|nr:hypothetical protein J1N35_025320 [Gossypium stocksii]